MSPVIRAHFYILAKTLAQLFKIMIALTCRAKKQGKDST